LGRVGLGALGLEVTLRGVKTFAMACEAWWKERSHALACVCSGRWREGGWERAGAGGVGRVEVGFAAGQGRVR
jgi:hypothetical protein